MKEQTIRVLKVEPKKEAVSFMLKNELSELQKAVSGYIELVPLDDMGNCILCNEEGKLRGLPGNRHVGHDIIAGTFFVVGSNDEGDLTSLSDEALKTYMELFKTPEDISDDEVRTAIFAKIIAF